MNWNFFTFSKTHPGKVRPYNEDSLLDLSAKRVWVVADGMGGHEAGDIASQMLVDTIEKYANEHQDFSIDDLRKAVLEANYAIYDYARNNLDGKTMGTTLVLLYIQDGFYHCLWVGDSRIYLMRNNQLVQKTRDHSQVMDLVDQGLLNFDDAESHPLANVITRAIGVEPDVVVDQVSGQLVPGDQFLLCSDGLTKELNNAELARSLQADAVAQSGLALMHSALVKGAQDNVTCALIKATAAEYSSEVAQSDDATVPIFARSR
ncbi:putative Serine/threonine protein phosphatase [Vibrio nigripulchritudo MADA3029]|uniref:Putative Serine/threonine protein phosphatase n=1 Tax=Vibrio nigripulchritudo TaxID=28173 RepID=U4JXB1_9VIBR|nr:protein phosphatase 2C domain-containing protein [Vibrio nigripulchritudo]EGU51086.1 serine/threonine protein phosphatase [Vibrio nigripulchritudo ATCC 27043]KJY79746.1 serine/threonine protein phosphatase [Vibrio nigripulchritudo]CCN36830.1 putative Serine/threonine protein phosphatase [Vibrio nigripulchritudo AM115]CCN44606.1 putative Serine/threonine protein phosphatase [Vibrio nigripulchritudo FTn2]CCN45722.1 putative Serine/threonine protein phosphatase [Vibrio nigripulchritudo MADA302